MPFIDRALRGSWSSIANDGSSVLRFVGKLGSKETTTRNSSQQQPTIMLDIDLLMDLDLRKVFPKLFQGYPILKWRVIKEKFFVGCFFG